MNHHHNTTLSSISTLTPTTVSTISTLTPTTLTPTTVSSLSTLTQSTLSTISTTSQSTLSSISTTTQSTLSSTSTTYVNTSTSTIIPSTTPFIELFSLTGSHIVLSVVLVCMICLCMFFFVINHNHKKHRTYAVHNNSTFQRFRKLAVNKNNTNKKDIKLLDPNDEIDIEMSNFGEPPPECGISIFDNDDTDSENIDDSDSDYAA